MFAWFIGYIPQFLQTFNLGHLNWYIAAAETYPRTDMCRLFLEKVAKKPKSFLFF